ncbi:MAG: CPBP family intramembrane metalloprotease [Deltaproteobacteria bacterium]|nr:MAG: CPBP family intramembrane metalloprotease [Deltaproteobacteria bacterium]
MTGLVTRTWRRLVTEPLAWVDAHGRLPAGRLGVEARTTIVLVAACAVLAIMSYGVLSPKIQDAISGGFLAMIRDISPETATDLQPFRPLLRIIVWSIGAFTAYFCVPALIVTRLFGHRLSDYGLSFKGIRNHLWVYFVLFLPVFGMVLMVASAPDFQAKYPFYRDPVGVADLVVWECFYALQFFSLEFFFRGFLIHGLKDRMGRYAIFVMVVPYTMIHFSKPFYESLGAIGAGSILGLLSLRTGSIFGGWLIHVGVALSMDIAALLHRGL